MLVIVRRLIPLAAGTAVLLGASGASGTVPAECRVVLPPGEVVRVEWPATGTMLLTLRGTAPAGEISSACVKRASISPVVEGSLVSLEFAPGTLRTIEPGASGAILVFRAASPGGPDVVSAPGPGSYRIGLDDVLTVSVPSHNLSRDVVVDRNGTVTFDYVGAVAVAGLSATEAARTLQELLNRDSLVDPEVSVVVKEYASQYVFVTGQVRKPGKVPLRGATTLKDILADAGGLEKDASDEIVVTRQHEGGEPEVFRFSRMKVEGESANMSLQPRDEVSVAERPYFFIQGEVQVPSQYPFRPGVTLMQSISIANGLKEWANRREVRILRTANGGAEKLVFDLRDIERQKAPDPALEPGDIVIVPRRLM